MRSHFILFLIILLGAEFQKSQSLKAKKVHFQYPIRIIQSTLNLDLSHEFRSNLTDNELVCFENYDYSIPSLYDAALCIIPFLSWRTCSSLWGSRSIVIQVQGDVEFMKVHHLPNSPVNFHSLEDTLTSSSISLNATRWLLYSSNGNNVVRDLIQLPAEPITICARSSQSSLFHFHHDDDYEDSITQPQFFVWEFRQAYLRERDRRLASEKLIYHLLLLSVTTLVWVLPYVVAFIVAVLSYMYGMEKIFVLLIVSSFMIFLTHVMLTKKNRSLATMYLHYYFNRKQAIAAKQLLKQKKPLFQAFFFSCLLLSLGSMAIYIMYHYFNIDREIRNHLLKLLIALSTSWFAFFLCRSFDRFISDWVWIVMSVALTRIMEIHMNPVSKDKVGIVVMILSFIGISLTRRLWKGSGAKGAVKKFLPNMHSSLKSFLGTKFKSKTSLTSSQNNLNLTSGSRGRSSSFSERHISIAK